jgi:hypothetical protein
MVTTASRISISGTGCDRGANQTDHQQWAYVDDDHRQLSPTDLDGGEERHHLRPEQHTAPDDQADGCTPRHPAHPAGEDQIATIAAMANTAQGEQDGRLAPPLNAKTATTGIEP